MEIFGLTFLDNTLRAWFLALLTAVAITVILLLTKRIFLGILRIDKEMGQID